MAEVPEGGSEWADVELVEQPVQAATAADPPTLVSETASNNVVSSLTKEVPSFDEEVTEETKEFFKLEPPSSTSFAVPAQDDDDFGGEDDGFGDFDSEPVNANVAGEADDDFGDFGDFDDGTAVQAESFDEEEEPPQPIPAQPTPIAPPQIPTFSPNSEDLQSQINEILSPIYPSISDPYRIMGPDDVRQVPGLAQVLVDEESRALFKMLSVLPADIQPLDWTRSKVRREYLITMGVPVNLDEVVSTHQTSLPPLQISTLQQSSLSSNGKPSSSVHQRPSSVPPQISGFGPLKRSNTLGGGAGIGAQQAGSRTNGIHSNGNSRNGSPIRSNSLPQPTPVKVDLTYGLGAKPEIDSGAIQELLLLSPSSLSIESVSKLESLKLSLNQQTAEASIQLAYLLQLKDALTNDSEYLNAKIGVLVTEAAKSSMAANTTSGSSWRNRRSVQASSKSGRFSPAPAG